MKFRLFTLFVLLAAAAWSGTLCQSGTLANLTSQGNCTIGNLDFNFQSASLYHGLPGSTPASSSGIGFVPLVGVGMQGFMLTGPLSASGGEGTADSTYGRITYFITGATNLEVTTLLGEAAVGGHPDTDCQLGPGYCYIDATAMSGIGLRFGDSTFAAVGHAGGAGSPLPPFTHAAGWLALGPFTGTSEFVSFASVSLQVNPGGLNHDGTANAYLSSATYWFRDVQTQGAPEPGTWLMIASAFVPLIWRRGRAAK